MKYQWYKENDDDNIWWLDNDDTLGDMIFSFDKKKKYNLFSDYPNKLSAKEKEIFYAENPYWADFFKE